ncbi:MAG: 2-amino-4-hydroxy-6-hydroxymethyldihydropteridine diphosphokinase [Verrucomicrobiota bacterium]
MKVGIGIGSNLGDRRGYLDSAIEALRFWDEDLLVASYYETAPVDCPEESMPFLNTVVLLNYRGGLFGLLADLQRLEAEAGRKSISERKLNSPRPLDLDILFCEDVSLKTDVLEIPHPRMWERIFVLEPLAEIFPEYIHPNGGPIIGEQLEVLKQQEHDQICKKIN